MSVRGRRQGRVAAGAFLALTGLGGLGGLGATLGGCGEVHAEATTTAADETALREVEVVSVQGEPHGHTRRLVGTVVTRRVLIAARSSGPVDDVLVQLGDRVEMDQPLIRIRAGAHVDARRAASAQLAEARARLGGAARASEDPRLVAANARVAQAERDVARLRALSDERAASRQDRERAETELALAASQLRTTEAEVLGSHASLGALSAHVSEASRALGDATLRAPFRGSIAQRRVEPGQLVAPGDVLMEVVADERPYVRFALPEDLAGVVLPGAAVRVAGAVQRTEPVAARVDVLAGALDAEARTRTAHAVFESDPPFLAGATVEIEIPLDEAMLVRVPRAALDDRGGARRVFVADDEGRLSERLLSVGASDAEHVWSERGVASGERVVLNPRDLRDGDRVRVGGST